DFIQVVFKEIIYNVMLKHQKTRLLSFTTLKNNGLNLNHLSLDRVMKHFVKVMDKRSEGFFDPECKKIGKNLDVTILAPNHSTCVRLTILRVLLGVLILMISKLDGFFPAL
ncbi:hypothetical protein L9F63_023729, partial [Diploptera punctata]